MRFLTIKETNGIYVVLHAGGQIGAGRTLEKALEKATGTPTYEMGSEELIDTLDILMGPKTGEGQIRTGVQSA